MSDKGLTYYKINNFSTNGTLGISNEVIIEIAKKAIEDTEGVNLFIPHSLFDKAPISVKFDNKGNANIKLVVTLQFGYNATTVIETLKERIEHDLLWMTEIKPKKIDITIDA